VVISATNSRTNKKVAIKRIKPYAGDEWEARHTLREIQLMRLLDVHPNIISLSGLWTREDNELYLVMELMDSDLHQIIQSKQSLSESHHQCLMKQLLLGVQAMHKCGVLHRDLKPGNLLVTRDCQLRITDFGLARAWSDHDTPARQAEEGQVGVMTEYVVTRWYRSPELLLAPNRPYHGAIDLWSVGCIFGELLTRRPLFPGKSYVHQVQVILDILGTPSSTAVFGFEPRDDAAAFLQRQRHRPGISWDQLLPTASSSARDFMAKLLTWDPEKRMGVDEALTHEWLGDAPTLPVESVNMETLLRHKRAQNITFSFEDPQTPLGTLKNQIYAEVALYKNNRRPSDVAAASSALAAKPASSRTNVTTAEAHAAAVAEVTPQARMGGGSSHSMSRDLKSNAGSASLFRSKTGSSNLAARASSMRSEINNSRGARHRGLRNLPSMRSQGGASSTICAQASSPFAKGPQANQRKNRHTSAMEPAVPALPSAASMGTS